MIRVVDDITPSLNWYANGKVILFLENAKMAAEIKNLIFLDKKNLVGLTLFYSEEWSFCSFIYNHQIFLCRHPSQPSQVC